MAKSNDPELIDAMFSHGLDFENRRIFLFDELNSDSAAKLIKGIYFLDSKSSSQSIEVFVNCPGGETTAMLAVYDTLNSITCPVITVGMGLVASAAPLIVAAGSRGMRYAMPNSSWMLHQGEAAVGSSGRLSALQADVKQEIELNRRWCQLMARHSNKSEAYYSKICRSVADHNFTAEEALELGLIDHLWNERG